MNATAGNATTARFAPLTPEAAPSRARPLMAAAERHLGHLPDAVARLAHSPETLDAFQHATARFDAGTLDPLARETVVMALAARNGCHVCRAMHTARLRALDADPAIVDALRDGGPLPDPRLETVRRLALALASGPGVDAAAVEAFLAAGFTERQALEVVLGVGTYTISTLANVMTGAELDGPMRAHA